MLDEGAFCYCHGLTNITIPNSVTNIGIGAFNTCTGLISVSIPNTVTYIGGWAFDACTNLLSIAIPTSITYIRENTFSNCTNLTDITIPNSVTQIHNDAFLGCDSIKHLFYNSNANVPNKISHLSLQTVSIGNNVNSVPSNAFTNATNLTHVIIGSSVSSIGNNAFRFCSNLDTIIALPATAPSLGSNVFQGTPDTKIVVTGCESDYASVWGTAGFNYVTGGFTLILASNNEAWGTASFVQGVNCQQTAIIQAVPTAGHRFVAWSDGNVENPRTITLIQNTSLTANFEEHYATVNATSANEMMGTVNGGGFYLVDGNVTLTAIANCNYRFTHWQDGITTNPRTITVTDDTAFVAYFELNSDTVIIHDTTYIDVPYAVHDTTVVIDTLTVTEYVSVHDTTYITMTDTVTNTIYDTITNVVFDTIDNYIYDTTIVHDTTLVTDTLYLTLNDTIYITIHDTIYVYDTIYVGVDEVDMVNAKVYINNGQIVVDGTEGNQVWLYDINGRLLATKQDNNQTLRFDVQVSGTYLVKIGNHPARRVVVIR